MKPCWQLHSDIFQADLAARVCDESVQCESHKVVTATLRLRSGPIGGSSPQWLDRLCCFDEPYYGQLGKETGEERTDTISVPCLHGILASVDHNLAF
jgi:hypothetical protein